MHDRRHDGDDPNDVTSQMLRLIEDQRLLIERQQAAIAHHIRVMSRAWELARIGLWECDIRNGNRIHWSDGVYDLFEVPRGTPISREEAIAFYTAESRAEMEVMRNRLIADGDSFSVDIQVVTALGNLRWLRLTADIEFADGEPVRLFGLKQDITEEKRLSERLRQLAEFDPVTGLANRATFQDALASDNPMRRLPFGALLLIDLDGFKQVNDTHGHAEGDRCLARFAELLRGAVSDAVLTARIGGDEFAVLLPPRSSLSDAIVVAETIIGRVVEERQSSTQTTPIGASIGIAVACGRGAADTERLFNEADAALYAAKRAGRSTWRASSADTLTPWPQTAA